MPKKVPELPGDMFTDDNSAIARLTGSAGRSQVREPVPAPSVEEVEQQPKKEGSGQNRNLKQTSFYMAPDQLDKLDDLASEYNKRYRRQRPKINRNDIVRFLVDHVTFSDLVELE
jgi:hypothetical protein